MAKVEEAWLRVRAAWAILRGRTVVMGADIYGELRLGPHSVGSVIAKTTFRPPPKKQEVY